MALSARFFSSAFGAINAIQTIRRQSIENDNARLDLAMKEQEAFTNPLFDFSTNGKAPLSRKQVGRYKSYDKTANMLLRHIQGRLFGNKANSLDYEGYGIEDNLAGIGELAHFGVVDDEQGYDFRHETPYMSKEKHIEILKNLKEFEDWHREQTKLERQFEYSKGQRREKFQEKLDKHQEYLNELRDNAVKSIFGDSDTIDNLDFWDFVLLQLYNLDESKFDVGDSISQIKQIFEFINPLSGVKDSIKDMAGIFSKFAL